MQVGIELYCPQAQSSIKGCVRHAQDSVPRTVGQGGENGLQDRREHSPIAVLAQVQEVEEQVGVGFPSVI